MQTPSGTNPLDSTPGDEKSPIQQVEPGASIQKIVRFDLREEGSHVRLFGVIPSLFIPYLESRDTFEEYILLIHS